MKTCSKFKSDMNTTTNPPIHSLPPATHWALCFSACVLLAGGVSNRVAATENWMFATPAPLPAPINLPGHESLAPFVTTNGLTLYFTSDRPGGYGKYDIWVAERSSTDAPWGEPVNLGPTINTDAPDGLPTLSADELTLYFSDGNIDQWTPRNGSPGDLQLWMSTRATRQSPWEPPTVVGPPVYSGFAETWPSLSSDGLSMHFTRYGAQPGYFVTRRNSVTEPWLAPTRLPSTINQGTWYISSFVSADDRHLFFDSNRSGSRGMSDLWVVTRASATDPWTKAAVNLGTQVNTSFLDINPWVSADFPNLGSFMLFARNNSTSLEVQSARLFRTEVIPNLIVQRSSNLASWTPVVATFTKLSANTIQSEVSVLSNSTKEFYRVVSIAGGNRTVKMESSERVGSKIRLRYTWTE